VTYEVTAVRYGTLHAPRSSLFYRYEAYDEPDAEVEMAYYFWLLRGGGRTILVDTGFDPDVGRRRGRTCLCPPLEALHQIGVEPAAISAVVITHLHYDHIGNLGGFPHAELVVPRKELDFWTGPYADRVHFRAHVEPADIARLEAARKSGRVRETEGTEELFDGIIAHTVGGHSPGQQMLAVTAAGSKVVLTSDAVHFYEELELERPFSVIADLEEMYRAYDLLREWAREPGTILVPAHDPEVQERFDSVALGGTGAEAGGAAVTIA
jgi:glyoxylase-like metal-dependent hydrolase (beta-lactamase superfamily II)